LDGDVGSLFWFYPAVMMRERDQNCNIGGEMSRMGKLRKAPINKGTRTAPRNCFDGFPVQGQGGALSSFVFDSTPRLNDFGY